MPSRKASRKKRIVGGVKVEKRHAEACAPARKFPRVGITCFDSHKEKGRSSAGSSPGERRKCLSGKQHEIAHGVGIKGGNVSEAVSTLERFHSLEACCDKKPVPRERVEASRYGKQRVTRGCCCGRSAQENELQEGES